MTSKLVLPARLSPPKRSQINRRAFLRGAGAGSAIAIGLPFLEGLPARSAWAQDDVPVFSFFICSANGVVPGKFWPGSPGALSASSFEGKALSKLADYASNLLIIGGVGYPSPNNNCGHAQGLCMALTGVAPQSGGPSAQAGGKSADMTISEAVNPQGVDPLTLYSGAKNYIGERLSFAGPGNARSAQVNPYAAFQTLMGVDGPSTAPSAPTGETPVGEPANVVDEVLLRRKSVNDYVRDDFASLLARTDLSSADRDRLEQHMEAVRRIELNLDSTGSGMNEQSPPPAVVGACSLTGVDVTGIEAFKNGIQFSQNGNMIEDIVKLHFEVVALAFSCNANRVATLQWGDGTDGTKYAGISGPGWPFHQISHRVPSDAEVGQNPDAEQAHAEIDVIRMETFAHGLKHFADRGLLDHSLVYWTSHVAEGNHSPRNLPIVIAGSAGGVLKQGEYITANNTSNDKVLGTLISAAGGQSSASMPDMLA